MKNVLRLPLTPLSQPAHEAVEAAMRKAGALNYFGCIAGEKQ